MLFKDIATINIASRFDARLVLTAVLVTVIMFVSLILSIAVGDDKRKAAFAQGVFRSVRFGPSADKAFSGRGGC